MLLYTKTMYTQTHWKSRKPKLFCFGTNDKTLTKPSLNPH